MAWVMPTSLRSWQRSSSLYAGAGYKVVFCSPITLMHIYACGLCHQCSGAPSVPTVSAPKQLRGHVRTLPSGVLQW